MSTTIKSLFQYRAGIIGTTSDTKAILRVPIKQPDTERIVELKEKLPWYKIVFYNIKGIKYEELPDKSNVEKIRSDIRKCIWQEES